MVLSFIKIMTEYPAYLPGNPSMHSSSNDFGYTTGPWKYYENTPKENPIAQGHFITVWHITKEGSWKFLIDFGINYSKQANKIPLQKFHTKNVKSKNKEGQTLRESEEAFIEAWNKKGVKAYKDFLSENSRLNYKGFLPATTSNQRNNLLDSLPRNIQYTIAGSGEAPGHDLGYVYGTEKINDKEDGYLRIWRKEKEGWKIAAEVLHFNE
jgi:hypothetical protein